MFNAPRKILIAALRRWLCREGNSVDRYPQGLEAPGALTRRRSGDPTAHVTLRPTKALDDRHGRIPEEVAAATIASVLSYIGIGFEIAYGFESIDVGTEQASCTDDDAKDRYESVVKGWDESARDANILLTDAEGGGCAQWWDSRTAAVGFRGVDSRAPHQQEGGDHSSKRQALLHELGHCLGASHDHDDSQSGNQSPGVGHNDDEREVWVYSPTMFNSAGVENRCGEQLPEREYDDALRRHVYSNCAKELFKKSLRERPAKN